MRSRFENAVDRNFALGEGEIPTADRAEFDWFWKSNRFVWLIEPSDSDWMFSANWPNAAQQPIVQNKSHFDFGESIEIFFVFCSLMRRSHIRWAEHTMITRLISRFHSVWLFITAGRWWWRWWGGVSSTYFSDGAVACCSALMIEWIDGGSRNTR